jgi:hypothetical protein
MSSQLNSAPPAVPRSAPHPAAPGPAGATVITPVPPAAPDSARPHGSPATLTGAGLAVILVGVLLPMVDGMRGS